jgi:hypothetical protein
MYKVFLEYVDLYLSSEWGRFYVGHPVVVFTLQKTHCIIIIIILYLYIHSNIIKIYIYIYMNHKF